LRAGLHANVSPGALGMRYQRFAKRVRAIKGRRASGDPAWRDPLELAAVTHGTHAVAMRWIKRIDFRAGRGSRATRRFLSNVYSQDNAVTASLSGLDLASYGYEM